MTDQRPQQPLAPRQRLETAAVILCLARPMLDGGAHPPDQLHWIAGRLAESLADVLAVAAGQSGQLPPPRNTPP